MKPANRAAMYTACCYPDLAEICRKHGYALAAHGSLARDFDLVAIPWTDRPSSRDEVVEAIIQSFSVKYIGEEQKPHGRVAVILAWLGEAFIDLSFMPLFTEAV